jgi:uncharacterized protein (TIGR01777 family)
MRVAVAGATGMLGAALVDEMRRDGDDVVRLIRGGTDSADTIGWDPSYGKIRPDALKGFDAVVNLYGTGLGGKRWTASRKEKIRESRVVPARTLADAAAADGVPVLLAASSVAYYGDTGELEVDETAPPGDGFLARVCEDWEEAAVAAADAGVRVAQLRMGTVIGRNGVVGSVAPLFRAMLGGRLGDGRQYLSWIAVADAVAAIRLALSDGTTGPVNVTAPNPVTNREFTTALGTVFGRPAPMVYPRVLLRPALGEYADAELLASFRAVPAVLREKGFTFRYPRIDDALTAAVRPA